MPSSDMVLAGLTAMANDWRWLAITWHVLLGVTGALFLLGWRPSVRLLGCLLIAPLVSVSLIAWVSRNPFNGSIFLILAAVLGAGAVRVPSSSVRLAPVAWFLPGVASVVFGWTYPHFVRVESWTTYLYASPFGLLPCPTLSALIGGTLVFSSLRSTSWSAALVLAGLLYGGIGVFGLGIALDLGLLVATGVLAAAVLRDATRRRSVRADQDEVEPANESGRERVSRDNDYQLPTLPRTGDHVEAALDSLPR